MDPAFDKLFKRYLDLKKTPPLDWKQIEPPKNVIEYESLSKPSDVEAANMLNKLVIVKLNGGLGTSMGCTGPKSVIQVRNDMTFLDITVKQITTLNKTFNCNVPLVLMNSFNTHEDTKKLIQKYKNNTCEIHTFVQSKFPRINKETLQPEPNEWYPPGHGDFYEAFYNSGLLNRFIDEGREYCFVSNIDNLGANVDICILNELFSKEESPNFVMEVTPKTMADVKGGTLVDYQGHVRLLEIAQVPPEHIDEFKSIKKFKIFNTNNLWLRLKSIKELLTSPQGLELDIIVNSKHLESGANVIQLETAAGAAMKYFDRAIGLNVPRSRFVPVKKTSDLLLVMSNLFKLEGGSLMSNQQRLYPQLPLIKLCDIHFNKVRNFLERFLSVPDLLELNHLTVSGDVTFGKNVTLRGTVIIIANHGDRIDIPSGALLENKIVSGNLRILDH